MLLAERPRCAVGLFRVHEALSQDNDDMKNAAHAAGIHAAIMFLTLQRYGDIMI